MKQGILIYQAPSIIGGAVIAEGYDFANFSFMGTGKGRSFLEQLQNRLVELNYPVTVVKDDTWADLEEITFRNYDFIICAPGLQNKLLLNGELPQIFFIDSLDYHNSLVSKIIIKIKNNIL